MIRILKTLKTNKNGGQGLERGMIVITGMNVVVIPLII